MTVVASQPIRRECGVMVNVPMTATFDPIRTSDIMMGTEAIAFNTADQTSALIVQMCSTLAGAPRSVASAIVA